MADKNYDLLIFIWPSLWGVIGVEGVGRGWWVGVRIGRVYPIVTYTNLNILIFFI